MGLGLLVMMTPLAALILGVGGNGEDGALVLALVGVFLCTCGGKMVFNASNPHERHDTTISSMCRCCPDIDEACCIAFSLVEVLCAVAKWAWGMLPGESDGRDRTMFLVICHDHTLTMFLVFCSGVRTLPLCEHCALWSDRARLPRPACTWSCQGEGRHPAAVEQPTGGLGLLRILRRVLLLCESDRRDSNEHVFLVMLTVAF